MKARADLEDEDESNRNKHDEPQLVLNKSLLDYISHIRFTTKFKLQHIGIFCRWVLFWILEDAPKEYELLYEEAVPHLIDMQAEINSDSPHGINGNDNNDPLSVRTNDNNSENNQNAFDFPDLMRRSSVANNNKTDGEKNTLNVNTNNGPPKLKKVSSQYTSGLFLSHGNDVLGNDYMKVSNASSSSLPRALINKNMNSFARNDMIKSFDDAKSDITAISMSQMSTMVNAPLSPKISSMNTNINVTTTSTTNSSNSPLAQHVSSLPSPEHLASVDDLKQKSNIKNPPKISQEYLIKQESQFLNDMHHNDKLKIFGYVYEENNDDGLFACIINNSDKYLSLSMSLINSIIQFEKRLQLKHQQQSGKGKKGGKKNRNKQNIHKMLNDQQKNEEREEYLEMRRFEDNGLLNLVINNNSINECKDNNNQIIIKDGCIISNNVIIGDKTRIDKCILDSFVTIGKNCKIINCVIFKHVTIGDNCQISNTIISSYANICDKCTIRNCKIADRANISKQSTFKNETLQSGTINDFDDDNDDDTLFNNNNNNNVNNNDINSNMVNID